ncbi:hypothetical protein BpHYR1_051586 [Brachionus plicatilis]|uniref:Uncharacterized protein n=1 Tax=Brachionus plicatilis TaxID=10195 RepID=A0A3M7PPK2_BRAPC|nr:hypothetical protein BpHYR1_051586 [Brachionus plicatilis]
MIKLPRMSHKRPYMEKAVIPNGSLRPNMENKATGRKRQNFCFFFYISYPNDEIKIDRCLEPATAIGEYMSKCRTEKKIAFLWTLVVLVGKLVFDVKIYASLARKSIINKILNKKQSAFSLFYFFLYKFAYLCFMIKTKNLSQNNLFGLIFVNEVSTDLRIVFKIDNKNTAKRNGFVFIFFIYYKLTGFVYMKPSSEFLLIKNFLQEIVKDAPFICFTIKIIDKKTTKFQIIVPNSLIRYCSLRIRNTINTISSMLKHSKFTPHASELCFKSWIAKRLNKFKKNSNEKFKFFLIKYFFDIKDFSVICQITEIYKFCSKLKR